MCTHTMSTANAELGHLTRLTDLDCLHTQQLDYTDIKECIILYLKLLSGSLTALKFCISCCFTVCPRVISYPLVTSLIAPIKEIKKDLAAIIFCSAVSKL
jgi:hypothetical protein